VHRYKRPVLRLVAAGAAAVSLLVQATPASASAGRVTVSPAWTRAYVSPHGSSRHADRSCSSAKFRSINAAISWVRSSGTVIVCRGTYHTQAVITKPLTLIGEHAVINAAGQQPVLKKLPGGSGIVVLGTRRVTIGGFRVTRAAFDAILVARSRHVLVTGNTLVHNGDVGVDFNGTSLSVASHNRSEFNKGGGFLVADDVGRAQDDTVSWNVASHNPGGCGVIIAGHSTSGVRDNRVAGNLLTDNGTSRTAPGAGVVIASEVPGETVAGNTVTGNRISGNGLAGVTIHAHVKGQDLTGNSITGNWIGRNNVVGDPIGLGPPVKNVPDPRTTGILVGASSHVHVTISGNHISRNWYGIFLEGRVSAALHRNVFTRVHTRVKVAA
jgi:parallel beta-helix repeat protein